MRSEPGGSIRTLRGNPWLPLVLVLVALAGLVVVPWAMQRKITSLRAETTEITSPGQRLITRVQSEIAMELVEIRAYLLTGDAQYANDYRAARARKNAALDELVLLSSQLEEVRPSIVALREGLVKTEPFVEQLFAGKISRTEYTERFSARQATFREEIARASRVGEQLSRMEFERRAAVDRLLRWSFWSELGLVALALFAALDVALLGRRHWLLAVRLERYSRSQTALKEAARAFSEATTERQVGSIAAEAALRVVEASGAYVEHIEQPEADAEVVASAGRGTPQSGTHIPYPGSGTQKPGGLREVRVFNDIGERLAPYLRDARGSTGLVAPLSDDHVMCSLVLLRDASEARFTKADAATARSLADLMSAALRRVVALEALTASERRLREVTDNLEQVIWLGPPDLSPRDFVNPASESLLGVSPEEFRRDPNVVFKMMHPDDQQRVGQTLRDFPSHRFDERFRLIRRDGRVIWVRARHYPINNNDGMVLRVAGIMEDVSRLKAAEDERERLLEREQRARADADSRREDLERATRARSRLIRGFSHDLKNPLGVADALLQSMARNTRDPLTAGQRSRVARVRRSLRTVFDLIESLLSLARAQTGALELERMPTDLREVVAAAVEEYEEQAGSVGLELRTTSLSDRATRITSDPDRIRQVLGNLLSNAVKYTSEGHITVGLSHPGGERVGIFVADTGRGISKEGQEHVFEEFRRMEGADDQRGAGIGLAIAQAIAQALGGEITVESELGVGSTFTLWLPLEKRDDVAADGANVTLH